MSFSLIYLIQRFFYRIYQFLQHWYIGGFLTITHGALNVLERLDRIFALRVTLRYLFKPLYQDYTLIGYVLGFIFRSARIFIASIVYFIVIIIGFAIYVVWVAVLPYLIFRFFSPNL